MKNDLENKFVEKPANIIDYNRQVQVNRTGPESGSCIVFLVGGKKALLNFFSGIEGAFLHNKKNFSEAEQQEIVTLARQQLERAPLPGTGKPKPENPKSQPNPESPDYDLPVPTEPVENVIGKLEEIEPHGYDI